MCIWYFNKLEFLGDQEMQTDGFCSFDESIDIEKMEDIFEIASDAVITEETVIERRRFSMTHDPGNVLQEVSPNNEQETLGQYEIYIYIFGVGTALSDYSRIHQSAPLIPPFCFLAPTGNTK
ncbi:uncharacterized protein LOC128922734 [Zeugodacus cucurbitae]|uniref:uncharacterized protein LOC128922734 n=1 Tax=Zeugodacus cucurbitae TaxID=28588 RepID=UPI0023D92F0F|nr:uncharacterized protein LOC128922734 [Zeugodacus cucurbitae]